MAKEFTFGFKIAAALQGNFSGAFSVANNKITELNTKVNEYSKKIKQLESAYQSGILSHNSYYQALSRLSPEYDKLLAKQKQYNKQMEI